MNLNNEFQLKRNIENQLRKDLPHHAERILRERNLYSWWEIRQNVPNVVVERFFGNEYDCDAKTAKWKLKTYFDKTSGGLFHGERCS